MDGMYSCNLNQLRKLTSRSHYHQHAPRRSVMDARTSSNMLFSEATKACSLFPLQRKPALKGGFIIFGSILWGLCAGCVSNPSGRGLLSSGQSDGQVRFSDYQPQNALAEVHPG